MKAVLVSQQNPTYDDLPGVRYHFPRRYLKTVQAAINDSIIYYEPGRIPGQSRRDGRTSYFGVARLTSVNEDYTRPDHFYAHLKDYLPFSNLVPLRVLGELLESALKSNSRQVSGVAQSAVRPISDFDFEEILSLAFPGSEEVIEKTGKQKAAEPAPKGPNVIHRWLRNGREATARRAVVSLRRSHRGFVPKASSRPACFHRECLQSGLQPVLRACQRRTVFF